MRALAKRLPADKKFQRAFFFVFKALAVYVVWKVLFFLFNREGTFLNNEWIAFTNWFAHKTIQPAAFVLQNVFGFDLTYNQRNIFIAGTTGMFVANHCLGVSVCVIFSGLILAYEGKWMLKLWYIPLGIFCIYLVNVARLVGLGIVQKNYSEYFFDLAHTRVYLLMSYGMFFLLLVLWMNHFSKK